MKNGWWSLQKKFRGHFAYKDIIGHTCLLLCKCVWERECVCECESSIVCVYWDGIFRGEWVGCVNCFLFFFVSQFLSSWVRRCGSSANFVTTFLSGTSISQLLHLSNWLFCHKKLKTFLVIYSNQKLQKKLFQNAK
jgi:hypothetical protein